MADEQTQAQAITGTDAGQQSEQAQATTTQTERTFTQTDLDKIVADRLARERAKYADYDTLKSKAEQLEAANKSEIEKMAERAAKAEAALEKERREAKRATLTAEAKAAALGLKFKADKLDRVLRLIDLNDDSTNETVTAALQTLSKEMPELLERPTIANTGAVNPARGTEQANETREQRLARLRSGGQGFSEWISGASVVYTPDVNPKQQG